MHVKKMMKNGVALIAAAVGMAGCGVGDSGGSYFASNASPDAMAKAVTAVSADTINVDGNSAGEKFYGVGMVSGGGGNSRLLRDYAEPYRSRILDLLFKPNYGASLQVFKVEIGSDGNSTTGSEATVYRTGETNNYEAGYEGWLISEAKARNKDMKFQALPWGLPSSVASSGSNYWTQSAINYIVDYVQGTQKTYGMEFDYIGGRNERGYNKQFYIDLKAALQAKALNTKVVASDDWTLGSNGLPWYVATDMKNDASFRNVVDAVGYHTPHEKKTSTMTGWPINNPDAEVIRSTYKKPLFSSEDHFDSWGRNTPSGAELGSALNLNYINGKVTSSIFWPLINSAYNNYPFANMGLIRADQPWSGNYAANAALWAMAQTTQFIQPGWQYLDTACQVFNNDISGNNGSIVGAKSPDGTQWSVVVDMSMATASRTINLSIKNLPSTTLHRWSTKVTSANNADWFVQGADIVPIDGAVSFSAEPGVIYSLTTTTGQSKGEDNSAPAKAFDFPYSDNFDTGTVRNLPKYTADMDGAFELYPSSNGQGMVVRQMAPAKGIVWSDRRDRTPFTQLGSLDWSDYSVKTDVKLEKSGVVLYGRLGNLPQKGESNTKVAFFNGYALRVNQDGSWSLVVADTSAPSEKVLDKGTVSALGASEWHTVKLSMASNQISAYIDNVLISTVYDGTRSKGAAGFGTTTWNNAQFDNLLIDAASVNTNTQVAMKIESGTTYTLLNVLSKQALDNWGSLRDGTKVGQWENVANNANQQWKLSVQTDGTYVLESKKSGKALDNSNTTAVGANAIQWTSNGGLAQKWVLVNGGGGVFKLQSKHSGLFLDNGGATVHGQSISQQKESNMASQQWIVSPAY